MRKINMMNLSPEKEAAATKVETEQMNHFDSDLFRPTSPEEMTPAQYRAK